MRASCLYWLRLRLTELVTESTAAKYTQSSTVTPPPATSWVRATWRVSGGRGMGRSLSSGSASLICVIFVLMYFTAISTTSSHHHPPTSHRSDILSSWLGRLEGINDYEVRAEKLSPSIATSSQGWYDKFVSDLGNYSLSHLWVSEPGRLAGRPSVCSLLLF